MSQTGSERASDVATTAVWAACGPRSNGWAAGPSTGATAGAMFAAKVGADDRWADRAAGGVESAEAAESDGPPHANHSAVSVVRWWDRHSCRSPVAVLRCPVSRGGHGS